MTNDLINELLQYRQELFGFIRALVRNTHDAEDIFQETARIIIERPQGREGIENFRAWAKGVAHHKAMEYFRKQRVRPETLMPTAEMERLIVDVVAVSSPDAAEMEWEYNALRDCLGKMPEKSWRLIRWRFVDDKPYQEIARLIGKTEVAIRRAVSRARLILMDCVQGVLRPIQQGI